MKKIFLFFLLFSVWVPGLTAQVYTTQYRLPGLEWKEIQTDRFRIIYPAGYEQEARRSLSILELEYEEIQQYIGGRLQALPVILNPQNDRSNGFVTPFNFRSEIEIAPIKGKALNPQSGDWLESVLPHELVHALHFSVNPPALTRILGLFSPDLRRSVHSAAPLGLHEGTAVEYESHGTIPSSGRGNYPYFSHQFNSLLDTPEQWSMGQLFHTTDYTLPFNRHYVGGYHFLHWLQNNYGEKTAESTIRFHYKYPFLGYGVALRSKTGKWPGRLYREFSDDSVEEEKQRKKKLGEVYRSNSGQPVKFSGTCRRMNRPLWLDSSTLIFYGRFCNKPSGFYTYNLVTRESNLLNEVRISQDHIYNFSDDSLSLYFSRLHTDTHYDNVFRGDLHRLDPVSGHSERITNGLRVSSPEAANGQVFALKATSYTHELVTVNMNTGTVGVTFEKPGISTVIQVAAHPAIPDRYAVIGKINGVQGIWLESLPDIERLFFREPDIVFENGSVFDVSWHPFEEKLLFVSDHEGTMNIYEYQVPSDDIYRITHGFYNNIEPSYSPDGSSIAFISQKKNEQVVHYMDYNTIDRVALARTDASAGHNIREQLSRPLMNRDLAADTTQWESGEYQTGLGWLKPRLWLPEYGKENGSDRFTVNFQSVDQLNTQSYHLDLSHYLDRIWFDLEYTYKGFFPGFRVNIFNDPALTSFRVSQEEEEFIATMLQQSRGASLKIPVHYYLERNARFSSLLIEPQYFINQLRFLNPDNSSRSYSEFGTRHTVGLRTVLNLNIRRLTRDIQPSAGWSFFTESRLGLNRAKLDIQTDRFETEANLSKRRGFRGGISTFIAPLSRYNQSLRLTGQVVTQTDFPVFNISSLFSDNFSEVPLPAVNNLALFNSRYTIPITYPDDGGLLLPFYLSNIYLVLFSQMVTDLDQPTLQEGGRAVYGAGIRSRFRISNLSLDIGISLGWEPTRNEVTYYIGGF